MTTSDYPFKSYFRTRVSPKRNVQMPLSWKNLLEGQWFIRLGEDPPIPHIEVVPLHMLLASRIGNDPDSAELRDTDDLSDLLSPKCRQIHFGPRPRITLPRDWCDEVGIAYPGPVVVPGRGRSFEFWSEENFGKLIEIEFAL